MSARISRGARPAAALLVLTLAALPRPADAQPVTHIGWGMYLGGPHPDRVTAITQRGDGEIVLVGTTESVSLAPTPAAGRRTSVDIFLAHFGSDGEPQAPLPPEYRVFGGDKDDKAHAIVLASDSEAYIVGQTLSSSFPDAGATHLEYKAKEDAFLAKVGIEGDLQWVMYLGGSEDDVATGVVVANDTVYVSGWTHSPNFLDAPGGTLGAGANAFVVRVDVSGPTPQLKWPRPTIIGGPGADQLFGSALAGDTLLVVGTTSSTEFPLYSGDVIKNTFHGPSLGTDAFVAKLDLDSGELLSLAYVGGTRNDEGRAIAATSKGQFVVAGTTYSPLGPPELLGRNAFALWMTDVGEEKRLKVLGGNGDDEALTVVTDSAGNAFVGGRTTSSDLPRRKPFDDSIEPDTARQEGFVAVVPPEGGDGWVSFVGGDGADEVTALSNRTGGGKLVIALQTSSATGIPGSLINDPSMSGAPDGFIMSVNVLDPSAPEAGSVTATLIPPSTISASWEGFIDRNASIERYDWAIGTAEEPEIALPFTSVNDALEATSPPLSLVPGVSYRVTVRAQNPSGLTAVAVSNDVVVTDPSNPDGGTGGDDAGTDGGTGNPDGGTGNPDGGPGGSDAGTEPDGGPGEDDSKAPLGWGCASTGGAGLPLLLGLIVLLLLARRLGDAPR